MKIFLLAIVLTMLSFSLVDLSFAADQPIRDFLKKRAASARDNREEAKGHDLQKVNLSHNGVERSYYIYKPSTFRQNNSALIVFHGGEGSGLKVSNIGGMHKYAEELGFLAVYPNSPGVQWNDGRLTTKSEFDDVGFVKILISSLENLYGVSKNRVFAMGISNGGMFSQRLACDAAEYFQGIGSIVANLPKELENKCLSHDSVPMIFFNGTDDRLMPFGGGEITSSRLFNVGVGGKVLSYQDTKDFWVRKQQCLNTTGLVSVADNRDDGIRLKIENMSGCKDDTILQFYMIEGGGHNWPGSSQRNSRISGNVSQEVDATRETVYFFRRFGL